MAVQLSFSAFPEKVRARILQCCAEDVEPVLFLGQHALETPNAHAGHKICFKVLIPGEQFVDDKLKRLSIKRPSSGLVCANRQVRAEFLDIVAANKVLHITPKEHSLRSIEFPDLVSFLPVGFASKVKSLKIENTHHSDVKKLAACFPVLEKLELMTLGETREYRETLNEMARVGSKNWDKNLIGNVVQTKWTEIISQLPERRPTIDLKVIFGRWRIAVNGYWEEGFALDIWVLEQADGTVSTPWKPRQRWKELARSLSDARVRAKVEWLIPSYPHRSESPVRKRVRQHGPTKDKESPPFRWQDWMGDYPDDSEAEFLHERSVAARKRASRYITADELAQPPH